MEVLVFTVVNKEIECDIKQVVGDNDYQASFLLDEEWDDKKVICRVIWNKKTSLDITLEDSSCVIPAYIMKSGEVSIGVYADDDEQLTTEQWILGVKKSIREKEFETAVPHKAVWDEINEKVADVVTNSEFGSKVNDYLIEKGLQKICFTSEFTTSSIAKWKVQEANISSGTTFSVTVEGVVVNLLATYTDGTTAILVNYFYNSTKSLTAEKDISYIGLFNYDVGSVTVTISCENEMINTLKASIEENTTKAESEIQSVRDVLNDISLESIYRNKTTQITDVLSQNGATVTSVDNIINIEISDSGTWRGLCFYYTVPTDADDDIYITFDCEKLENNETSEYHLYLLTHGNITTSTKVGSIIIEDFNTTKIPLETLQELSLLGEEIKIGFTTNQITYMNFSNIMVSIGENMSLLELLKEMGYEDKKYNLMTLGDSITKLGTGTRGWVKYFMEKINCNLIVNTGVNSAVWTDYNDTVLDGNPTSDTQASNTLCNQVYKIVNGDYEAPDIIMIAIGTNGGINVNLTYDMIDATYYDSDNVLIDIDSVDRTTTTGAFRYANEKLHEKYPNALIFWCVPIMGYEGTRSAMNSVNYEEAVRKLTTYASVGFIDTNHCGINGLNEVKSNNGEYLIDGLHPNVNGAKKIGYYNAMKVRPYLNMLFTEE